MSRILVLPSGGATTDVNNPSPTLRHRPILSLPIVTDFAADGDVWRERIYAPHKRKTYKSFIQRQGDGKLNVQGCLAFFYQTQVWTKVG